MVAAATPGPSVWSSSMRWAPTHLSLTPLYAWARRGERAQARVPRNWGANVTLLASMSMRGMGPCLAVEGATTKAVFEAYLEQVLAPSLQPRQVVVMDNLSSHSKALGCASSSKRDGANSSTCLPTRPISIPSKKPSLKAQGASAEGRGAHPRSPVGSDGTGSRGGDGERRSGLFRASRLPRYSPTTVTDALEGV